MANPELLVPAGQWLARAGKATQFAGAVVSLALVAGVGIWGYKLLVRDMTGIPVVRAMEGSVREAPSNPGGEIVPHLGLSVNVVAAAGEAAPPEDRLLLAPVQAELSEEDMLAMPTAEADEPNSGADRATDATQTPVAAIVAGAQPLVDPTLLAVSPLAATAPANLPDAAEGAPDQTPMTAADVLALADQIATGTTPLADLAPGTEVPAVVTLDGVAPIAILDRSVPGVATALVPMARPRIVVASAAPTTEAPVAAPALTENLPAGTVLVQLGAFETPELAASAWDVLGQSFGDFMSGKSRVLQQASRGGLNFYRLRAMGFAGLDDARSFCAALAAEDAACVPVVVR